MILVGIGLTGEIDPLCLDLTLPRHKRKASDTAGNWSHVILAIQQLILNGLCEVHVWLNRNNKAGPMRMSICSLHKLHSHGNVIWFTSSVQLTSNTNQDMKILNESYILHKYNVQVIMYLNED